MSLFASSCFSSDNPSACFHGSAKRSESSKTASPERENVSHSVDRGGGGGVRREEMGYGVSDVEKVYRWRRWSLDALWRKKTS
jgi:hypothetical protein